MSIKRELVGPTRQGGFIGIRRALLLRRRQGPSLNIDFSTGSGLASLIAFTYTRATSATITDFEGLIKSCLSGELRIYGARRVRNYVQASENIQGTGWSVSGSASRSGASTLILTANGDILSASLTAPTGATLVSRVKLSGNGTVAVNFSGGSATVLTLTSTPTVYSWTGTMGGGVNLNIGRFAGLGNATSITVEQVQVEDVTGQSNQNPSEYVSVGVLSSPYHGYFVDGVKYFSYENGNTISSNVVTEAQGAAITGTMGYLPEGQRTNLCLQSQMFDNVSWVKSNITVVQNQAVAPDGTTTADLVYPSSTGTNRQVVQTIAGSAAGSVTGSIYAKAAGQTWLLMGGVAGGQNVGVYFDLTNGVVGTQVVGTGTIEDVGNGWYRCSVLVTETDTTSYIIAGGVDADNSANSTTNGTNGIYLWGAQLEAASFASTYIPTTTAAVTRNADVLTCPSAGIVGENGTTVVAYLPEIPSVIPSTAVIASMASDASNYDTQYLTVGGAAVSEVYVGGGPVAQVTGTTDLRSDTSQKIVSVFATNNVRLYVNGVSEGTPDTNAPRPARTTINIGCFITGALQANMPISAIKIYRQAMTAAQVAAL